MKTLKHEHFLDSVLAFVCASGPVRKQWDALLQMWKSTSVMLEISTTALFTALPQTLSQVFVCIFSASCQVCHQITELCCYMNDEISYNIGF